MPQNVRKKKQQNFPTISITKSSLCTKNLKKKHQQYSQNQSIKQPTKLYKRSSNQLSFSTS